MPSFSVKRPYTVLVAVILIIILGVVAFTRMTPDLLPDIELPYVVVITSYAGATPQEVESEVTQPLERQLATLEDIKRIESTSSENLSMLVLEFGSGADMDTVTVNIREKIELAGAAWNDYVGNPFILKLNPDMLPVTVAAASVEGSDTLALSSFLSDNVISELEGVEGVASVSVSGLIEQSVQVTLSPQKVAAANARIRAAILDKFSETAGEVEDGLGSAESGKSQLVSGKAQLTEAQLELAEKIAAARLQLEQGRSQLETLKASGPALTQLSAAVTGSQAAMAAREAAVAAANPEAGEEELAALLAADPEYLAAAAGLTACEQQLAGLGFALTDLPGLVEQLAAADSRIAAIDEALQKLPAQQAEASAQLYGKLIDVSVAGATLDMTIEQLKSALEEIESAEQAALDSADLTGILTLDTLSSILSAQNFSMPAGYIDDGNSRLLVSVGDRIEDVDELSGLVLMDMGLEGVAPVTLAEVAEVALVDNAGETYARIDGQNGVLFSFSKQSGYATAVVSDNIAERFDELEGRFTGLRFTPLMDQGDYIRLVVSSVLENLVVGAALAILILLLFLRDLRPTFITACSIPISVTFAIVLMYFSGVTLNIISMSGLAVGVGMLVDNSIVVIENIYRMRSEGETSLRAAVAGARQVSSAIVSSTLTTVCVFFPIVFVEGLTRQIFADMALTIGYSLLASLIVALTLVPAMAGGLFARISRAGARTRRSRLRGGYEKIISLALDHKAPLMIAVVALMAVSGVVAAARGFQYFPDMAGTEVSVTLTMPEGSSLEDTAATSDALAERILEFPEIDTVGAMLASDMGSVVGLGDGGASTEQVTMYALLSDDSRVSSLELADRIAAAGEGFDCEVSVQGASSMSSYSSALGGQGIAVKLYADDLDNLTEAARVLAGELAEVEGVASVDDGIDDLSGELRVTVNKNEAMKKGLTVAQVYAALSARITESRTPTSITWQGDSREVVLTGSAAGQLTRQELLGIELAANGADGKKTTVKLGEIASVAERESLASISRSGQRRCLTVTAYAAEGYSVTNLAPAIEKRVAAAGLPAGISYEFSGENETIMSAMSDLLLMMLLGIAIVYLIMVAQFQSLVFPLIVMFTIPLAFTGGLLALIITGKQISVVSMIGFVMLVGIIVNNGIVLIDYINLLRREGARKREAVVEACVTRLRPVLMTALTTIIGLLPLALGLGMGADLIQPVAIVCVGGLIYATVMTLLVVPAMYDLFSRRELRNVRDEDLEA